MSKWLYEETHSLRDHQRFWDMPPILKKSPKQMTKFLKSSSHLIDDEDFASKTLAMQCMPYLMKVFTVRNESGLWTDYKLGDKDFKPESSRFVDSIDVLSQSGQERFINEMTDVLGVENISHSSQLLSHFYILGYMISNEASIKTAILFHKFSHVSIKVKPTRLLCDACRSCGFDKAIVITNIPMGTVSRVVIDKEYESLDFETWTISELCHDWYSNGIVHPMAIVSESNCSHNGFKSMCDNCSKNRKSLSGGQTGELDFMTFSNKCILLKRLGIRRHDLLDAQRPNGRYIRFKSENFSVDGDEEDQNEPDQQ